jgi:hypothetical protein
MLTTVLNILTASRERAPDGGRAAGGSPRSQDQLFTGSMPWKTPRSRFGRSRPRSCRANSAQCATQRLHRFLREQSWCDRPRRRFRQIPFSTCSRCSRCARGRSRAVGFAGSRGTVRDAMARARAVAREEHASRSGGIGFARAYAWLVGWYERGKQERKHNDHRRCVETLCRIEPSIAVAGSLARHFSWPDPSSGPGRI